MWLFSLPVVVPQLRLLDGSVDPCGGDHTGAVLVLGIVCFLRAVVTLTLHLEVPHVQLIFKDVDFPVVAQKFFRGPDFSAFPHSSPS